jgi:hypothetical protein
MSLSKEGIIRLKYVFAIVENALSRRAIRQLIPNTSKYLCKTGFSNYSATKIQYRTRLNAAQDLRVHPSRVKPNIKRIGEEKKTNHPSHGKFKVCGV